MPRLAKPSALRSWPLVTSQAVPGRPGAGRAQIDVGYEVFLPKRPIVLVSAIQLSLPPMAPFGLTLAAPPVGHLPSRAKGVSRPLPRAYPDRRACYKKKRRAVTRA